MHNAECIMERERLYLMHNAKCIMEREKLKSIHNAKLRGKQINQCLYIRKSRSPQGISGFLISDYRFLIQHFLNCELCILNYALI